MGIALIIGGGVLAVTRSSESDPPRIATTPPDSRYAMPSTGFDPASGVGDVIALHEAETATILRALEPVPEPPVEEEVYVAPAPRVSAPSNGSYGPCGGQYPPCWVVENESSEAGLYGAYNSTGCGGGGCYGKWQFSTEWACKLGLPCDLSTATPEQQDEAARLLWNGGSGCSNWDAC